MLTQSKKGNLAIKHLNTVKVPNSIEIHSGQDVIKGLTNNPKSLPAKYFYDDRGSQLFEKICALPEYYPTRTEASILRQYSQKIAQITGACELVELGSGSSTKTRLLLDAYHQQGYQCKYVPIDVSAGILQSSAIQLQQEYEELHIEALVGTYDEALSHLEPTTLPARMIFFLGSSMGNFAPHECDEFLTKINKVLSQGDYFLLGIDLQKPKPILEAAYNDSQGVTAAFNLNMLEHLNKRFNANFDTKLFTHQAIYNPKDSQIEMYLHCQKSHVVHLQNLNLQVSWKSGESILTEISRKFNLETLPNQLESKGLKTIEIFTDPKQWFGLILCQVVK